MSVYLSTALCYVLLFIFVCSTSCEQALVNGVTLPPSAAEKAVELFDKDKIKGDAEKVDGVTGIKDVTVTDFYSPVIVSTGNYVVALAGVNRIETGKKKINLVTKYIEKEDFLKNDDDLSKTKDSWTTQFALQTDEINDLEKVVKGLLAVAKDNKLYLLSVNYSTKTDIPLNIDDSAFKLVVGDLNNIDKDLQKKIVWSEPALSAPTLAAKVKKEFENGELTEFVFGGSAFLTNKKILFALVVKNKQKKISVLMHLDDGNKIKSHFFFTEDINDCYPYFFLWGTKIIMIPGNCSAKNNNKIMESSDMGEHWKENTEGIFCRYDLLQNKQNFVTIKNEIKEILLFTEHKPITTAAGQAKKNQVNLWMSDGTRLKNIKKIADFDETITPINFLFADDKLFFLNQQLGSTEIKSVKLNYLKEQSTAIKDTIKAWSTTDAEISTLCKGEDAARIPCVKDGLVGFLSGTESRSDGWKNKYFSEDLMVTSTGGGGGGKAEKSSRGLKFSGGAGAKWEVGKKDEYHPYTFTNPGFTLVATVTIDENEKKIDNSLMGIVLDEQNNRRVGLLCSKQKKWAVGEKEGLKESNLDCKHNQTYSVALLLNKTNFFVYIDWKQLTGLNDDKIKIENTEKITHFYFGADTDAQKPPTAAEGDVTVTNVLLYNRPFTADEIGELKNKVKIPPTTNEVVSAEGQQLKDHAGSGSSEPQTPPTLPASPTGEKEKAPSPSRTEDGGVGGGVRVFSLLLAVLCVSAPLLHL